MRTPLATPAATAAPTAAFTTPVTTPTATVCAVLAVGFATSFAAAHGISARAVAPVLRASWCCGANRRLGRSGGKQLPDPTKKALFCGAHGGRCNCLPRVGRGCAHWLRCFGRLRQGRGNRGRHVWQNALDDGYLLVGGLLRATSHRGGVLNGLSHLVRGLDIVQPRVIVLEAL